MIGIKLEGQTELLDTLPDTQISLRLENPLLGDDARISPGSYTLPFELPGGNTSQKNSALLKNPDVIENNEAYQPQKATLLFNNVPFRKGTLQSTEAGKDRISSNFLFGLSQIDEKFKTAKLRDLLDETITLSDTAVLKKILFKRKTGITFNITINGTAYTITTGVLDLIDAINDDVLPTINTGRWMPYATEKAAATPTGKLSAPYVEIKLVKYISYFDTDLLITVFEYVDCDDVTQPLQLQVDVPEDYIVEAGDITDYYDDYDSYFAPYFAGTYPTDKVRWPVTFNTGINGDVIIKDNPIVNGRNTAGILQGAPNWGTLIDRPAEVKNYNSLQPYIMVKYILDKIADTFNFTYAGDFYELNDLPNMLLDNSVSLDLPQLWVGPKPYIFWRRSFNIAELVPDIKVVDFLMALKNRYNLAIYFDSFSQRVILQQREQIARSIAYDEVTPITSPINKQVDQRITGYTITIPAEDNDKLSTTENITVGIPEKTITLNMGNVRTISNWVSDGVFITGINVNRKQGDKFGLRIFHYRGLVDGTAFDYNGSSPDGDEIYESLNDSDLEDGLHTTFHQYWLLFHKNRRLVNVEMNLPFRSIINIEWDLKKRYNRSNFLVKSIDVKLTNTGMRVSNVELITMA